MSDPETDSSNSLNSDVTSDSDQSDTTVTGPVIDMRDLLSNHISQIRSSGSFATSHRFEEFPLLGISVAGIGDIGLPLLPDDARSLMGVSRKAPFGRGNQTLVDERVRNTLEIDGSKVSFANEAWNKWLNSTVVGFVVDGLGVVGDVELKLDKMLLYEQGAMFKAHKEFVHTVGRNPNMMELISRSTEKESGMFATLVICLPSIHTGGQVHLTHGTEEMTLSTAEGSHFDLKCLAW
jgi:hypothetical protein